MKKFIGLSFCYKEFRDSRFHKFKNLSFPGSSSFLRFTRSLNFSEPSRFSRITELKISRFHFKNLKTQWFQDVRISGFRRILKILKFLKIETLKPWNLFGDLKSWKLEILRTWKQTSNLKDHEELAHVEDFEDQWNLESSPFQICKSKPKSGINTIRNH